MKIGQSVLVKDSATHCRATRRSNATGAGGKPPAGIALAMKVICHAGRKIKCLNCRPLTPRSGCREESACAILGFRFPEPDAGRESWLGRNRQTCICARRRSESLMNDNGRSSAGEADKSGKALLREKRQEVSRKCPARTAGDSVAVAHISAVCRAGPGTVGPAGPVAALRPAFS